MIPDMKCSRCGHEWLKRKDEPAFCPRCHSPYYNKGSSERPKRIVKTNLINQTITKPTFSPPEI